MDLHYSQTQTYLLPLIICFTTLWIYTILKHAISFYELRAQFHYLMDLHYSQTRVEPFIVLYLFHYLMDLHYSQTQIQDMMSV